MILSAFPPILSAGGALTPYLLDPRDRSARHTPSDLPGQLPLRSMAQLARTVDGAKQPPPRGRVSPIGPRWRRVLASDCCRRSLGLRADACTRTRRPRPRSTQPHRRASLKDRQTNLRSTGADTRLSSNHGSNERSPLRRNFQPRRWRMAFLASARLLLVSRQNAAGAAPAGQISSPHHSCTAGSRSDHGCALAGAP